MTYLAIHKTNNKNSIISIKISDFCIMVETDHDTIHYYNSWEDFKKKWIIFYA